jgi:flagellar biosynthesis GTPase FlhF
VPDRDVHDDLVRRLYEAPPDGFVAARSSAIAEARKAGDREAVRRLGELRKPTVAAWLVNLLALRRPDLLDELTELAASLRAAQRDLHGDQLRELSTRRRQAVSALVAESRRLAIDADPTVSAGKLPLAEVETTLTAALSDVDVAEQVRSGRLIRAATYAGFGEVPRPRLRLITGDDTDEGESADADAESDADGSAVADLTARIGRRAADPGVDRWPEDEPDGQPSKGTARGSAAGSAKRAGGHLEAGPRGADQRSAGHTQADHRAAGQRSAEQREAGQREAEQREAEQRAAEQREAEQRAAEQRAADKRAEARRAALTQRRRELRQQLTAARAAETRAQKNLERAETAEHDAGHAVAEIEAALADLERRRAAAQADVSQRKLARRAAQRDAATARRRVGDVQAALEDLEDDLSGRPGSS